MGTERHKTLHFWLCILVEYLYFRVELGKDSVALEVKVRLE